MTHGGKREGAGRPRKLDNPRRCHIVFDEVTWSMLTATMSKLGCTRSEAVRHIINEWWELRL